jgi:hypothetical protein
MQFFYWKVPGVFEPVRMIFQVSQKEIKEDNPVNKLEEVLLR